MRKTAAVVLAFAVTLLTANSVSAADCQFILGFKTLRDLIGHEIVGECLENEFWNEIGDSNQRTTGGLMAWRKADNWTAFTDGYRTWINGPNGLVVRLNTERFPWEADYAPGGTVATPTPAPRPTPATVANWPGRATVQIGVTHRFTHDRGLWKETWEITVLEVLRGQALVDRISRSTESMARVYKAPPPGKEDIAAKIMVTMVGDSQLVSSGNGLTYVTCIWRVGWRCVDYAHPSSISIVTESGRGTGFYSTPADSLGEVLDADFVYTGESEIGWLSWRVWEGENVVMIVKMDDDQRGMSDYTAVFALR